MKIIYDTNFLMSVIKFKIDLGEELGVIFNQPYENIVLDSVITELKSLSKGRGKINNQAKLSLKLIKSNNFRVMKAPKGKVDDIILSLIDKDSAVATNDMELRKRLKSMGIKTIYLRAKKHLAIS